MNKSEQKFVDAILLRASKNEATRKDLERAVALLDEQIKGSNPALYAAMKESERMGF